MVLESSQSYQEDENDGQTNDISVILIISPYMKWYTEQNEQRFGCLHDKYS